MPLDKEKQGLELKDYESKLPNKTYALRVGKEVPEGSVNLAYVHTPKVQSDENISLIDTSYTSDNVIPQNQLQSMVVANESGELEYVDLIGNQEVSPRPPSSTFPTDKVNVTRRFKKNDMRTENALFYKFEIDYHYDSRIAMKNDAGEYATEKYSGQQIELTDENGNLLDDTYKYDIYVKAHADNPRIYSVRVYLHMNTDKEETIKIRYNHINKVVPNEQVQSVRRSIELYTNKSNNMSIDNQTRQMLEGGKLRIINGVSAYDKVEESTVRSSESEDEVFAVVPKEDGSGYKIIVPQKSETDPRVPRIFSHRVVAKYKGYDGQEVKVSVGHITDWCINPEALLHTELTDYSGAWKNIGIPAGNAKLNAKEMIELSLPFSTPSIPSDAEFYIEDDRGNLLYNIKTLTDNANVDTQVNQIMSKTVEAKANGLNEKPWKNALQDNTVIKNNPFAHRASIIPERQKTKWDFTWKANGQGYTERTTNYKTNWQVCADVGFKKTINPQTLDLLDKTKWSTIGQASTIDKWQYTYVPEIGKNVIEFLDNPMDIAGFYQRKENIGGSLTDLMNKTDYQFSVKVRLTDPVDDDMIGIMFRVRDAQNYYMFAWEKDEIATEPKTYTFDHGEGIVGVTNGCGRIALDEYGLGVRSFAYNGGATESWRWTNSKTKYLNEMGLKTKHKRIFKATPSTKAPSANPTDENTWNGSTRYPMDKTSCQFEDITETASYSAKGWEYNKDYKITVVVTGNLYRIYINDNVDSEDLGALVCQASDNTHQRGTYGIFCISQRWTYWYDLKMTEIEMDSICSEAKDVVLTDMTEKKLSNYMVQDILKPYIEDRARSDFGGAPYEVFGYTGRSAGEFTVRIDPRDNFVYGKTNNPAAGGVVRTDWKTDDNGLTVNGTGMVEYHEDGHFTIVTDPIRLPTEQVPSDVKGFSWNAPTITSGENVSIRLIPPSSVEVTATVPPITLVGVPYVLEDDMILKSEGIKHLEYLFDTDGETGFYNKLQIPNDVPKDEILLRIERGRITGLSPNGNATVENPEYRVNYRFQCQKNGFTRMPVDQFQDQVGVNRLRLKSILDNSDNFDSSVRTNVVAWTTFEELEAVPLFAIKVEEERKIEIEKPRVEARHGDTDNWYLRVKKGKFVKRIQLPYFDLGSPEKVPEIYVAYPQLLGMVTRPDEVVEVDLEYNIPEYTDQEFHNRPYTLIDKEVPVILNEYAIQTRYAPLVLQSEKGISYLEVYSVRANQRRNLRVSDVDAAKGIVYLLDRIREQDDVYVRYAYREDWFTYRGFTRQEVKFTEIIKTVEREYEGSFKIDLSGTMTSIDNTMTTSTITHSDDSGNPTIMYQQVSGNKVNMDINGGKKSFFITVFNLETPNIRFTVPEDKGVSVQFIKRVDNRQYVGQQLLYYQYQYEFSFEEEGNFDCKVDVTLPSGARTPYEFQYVSSNPTKIIPVSSSKEKAFDGIVTSGNEDKQERISLGEFAVKDIISANHAIPEGASIVVTATSTYQNKANISGISFTYKSDGKSITAREGTGNDVIVGYVYVMNESEKEYLEEPVGTPSFFHLDLNPTPGHFHTIAKNGFHRWIPINTDKEPFTIDPKNNNNIELLVKQIHVYLRPAAIRKVVSQPSIMASGSIIDGTRLARTIYHTDEEWWFNPKDYKYDPTMLRLGKVTLQANSTMKDNMTILDTRTRGGGLDEALSKEIIRQVNQESTYHWDIGYFDGEAYQENGVIVIRVPRSILKSDSNPNGFHESEVQEAVAQHKAYGLLPIVEYYDEVVDEKRLNIIPNNEFTNNMHIGYYDPTRSKGTNDLLHMNLGSGDNYVLRMNGSAEYAITIPGYKFENTQYRLDVKAMKEATAPTRSAGTFEIFYKDGTSRKIQLAQINRSQWMIYKEFIDVGANVHHVTITLNKTPETRTGNVIVDYVSLLPSPSIVEETTEIHEI